MRSIEEIQADLPVGKMRSETVPAPVRLRLSSAQVLDLLHALDEAVDSVGECLSDAMDRGWADDIHYYQQIIGRWMDLYSVINFPDGHTEPSQTTKEKP